MPGGPTSNTAQRALLQHGRDVAHRTYSSSGTDSYGDPSYSSSTSTVTARVTRTGAATLIRGPGGEEVDVDAQITVSGDLTITDTGEGDGRPDEFDVDGATYKLVRADTQDNGLIACDCVRT